MVALNEIHKKNKFVAKIADVNLNIGNRRNEIRIQIRQYYDARHISWLNHAAHFNKIINELEDLKKDINRILSLNFTNFKDNQLNSYLDSLRYQLLPKINKSVQQAKNHDWAIVNTLKN